MTIGPAADVTEVAGISSDEGDAFLESLYANHIINARRLAYLLTGDRALAEDLAHDAFIRAAGRLWALRSHEAFPSYIRKAVVNGVRSHWRSKRREQARVERSGRLATVRAGAELDVDNGVELGNHGELWAALERLPERQRAAIVLRFWLDLSERRTAQLLACRPGTVKSLVSRGLSTMRELVSNE